MKQREVISERTLAGISHRLSEPVLSLPKGEAKQSLVRRWIGEKFGLRTHTRRNQMTHREIENPFSNMEGYNCFGCGPANHLGLKMRFFVDAETDEVFSRVTPREEHCGFPGVLHGGIQATLLDEIAFWAIWEKIRKPAVTTHMEIDLKKAVTMPAEVEVRARVIEVKKRIARVETWLSLEGQVKARAKVVYYLMDPAKLHGIHATDSS